MNELQKASSVHKQRQEIIPQSQEEKKKKLLLQTDICKA